MECPPQDPTDNPVYIPFVDDFIVEFDEDAQIIAMSLPGGLVDEGARA